MSINKSYAVFGLGRYGRSVAKELIDNGAEVIAVDHNYKIVEECSTIFPVCKCADITDSEVIKHLGISNIDTVIIAIAGHFEASVMATMLCKEAGV
ncbi:MAG: NAD-binding protein, partial [Clostridia bacterium]|nr:NAD-binding protein [Clostridia bacterium]